MEGSRIYFCRNCKALDYAGEKCSRCSSINIVEASADFLFLGTINKVENLARLNCYMTKFSENIDYCAK